ncbi:MAG: hypothetical protein JXB49_27785 [Bacteroidales bacterium]|nr:hypothetical protein [Bacteroidales bacterium]
MDNWIKISEIWLNVCSALGIITAGIWTYIIFIHQRTGQPKINIQLEESLIKLFSEKVLVSIRVNIENIGNVVFIGDQFEIRLRQVKPISLLKLHALI